MCCEAYKAAEAAESGGGEAYAEAVAAAGGKMDRYCSLNEEHLTGPADGERAFERVREEFEKETAAREEIVERTGRALDNAFYFMEEAFGDSQEMVSFVTELNTNYYSIQYLKENDCDMYWKYNKRLLSEEVREKILGRMDAVENAMRE